MHVDVPPRSRAAPLTPFVPFALGEFHSGIPGCEYPSGRLVCLLVCGAPPILAQERLVTQPTHLLDLAIILTQVPVHNHDDSLG